MSDNIHLRYIEEKDALDFYHLLRNNINHLSINFSKTLQAIYSEEAAVQFIKNKIDLIQKREQFYFLIEIERHIIGCLSLKEIDWDVPKAEIAYFVDEKYQGKGITSRAINWLKDFCFNELKLLKLFARIVPDNIGSRKVVMKNGFIKEANLKMDHRTGLGELTDTEYYSVFNEQLEYEPIKK